jgi:hypothetical protein
MYPKRRLNHPLRNLILIGNFLSIKAGVEAQSPKERAEIGDLIEAWDRAVAELRTELVADSKQSVVLSETL